MTTLVVPGLLRLGLRRGSLLRAVISLIRLLLPRVHLLFNALLPALRVRDSCQLRLEHLGATLSSNVEAKQMRFVVVDFRRKDNDLVVGLEEEVGKR